MSIVHIRLNQASKTDQSVTYEVESPDFLDGDEWKNIGELVILKTEMNYKFIASKLAECNKLIPPELYKLPEIERKNKLSNEYMDYGWGMWSMRINHWANHFIENDYYPDTYPTPT